MRYICPFCRQPMKAPPIELDLPTLLRPLFLKIQSKGYEGVSSADLMSEFYQGRSPISLRTAIHKINGRIGPLRICSRRTGFYHMKREYRTKME